MDNYVPADETVVPDTNPFPDLFQDVKQMTVHKNAKFNHLNDHALKYLKESEDNRWIIFKAVDGANDKTISCVEVFKNLYKDPLFQWTKMASSKRVVMWKSMMEGPRDIRVSVDTPILYILLSKDPFPGELSCMSMQCTSDKEITFRETQSTRTVKSNKRSAKPNNKWTKPGYEQRKAEATQRHEQFSAIQGEVNRQ